MTSADVTPPSPGAPARTMPTSGRIILAGAIGNALEWYDFAIYGYLAGVIGKNFFPAQDATTSLIAAFGVFAAAFLARPFGSVIFGHIGDRFGRKRALVVSVAVMAVATTLVGLLPTHATLGPTAAILLTAWRIVQGLSVGGEHTTSAVFLVEHAPPSRKGLFGSFAMVAITAGTLLGSGVGALVGLMLGPTELGTWGWRIPFLLGAVLGLAAYSLRRSVGDDAAPAGRGLPVVEAFRSDWRGIMRAIIISITAAVSFYVTFVYLITYMQQVDGVSMETALRMNTASMVFMLLTVVAAGWAADRVGGRVVLAASLIGMILLAWPLFRMLGSGQILAVAIGQAGLAALVGIFGGAYPSTMAQGFAPSFRCSAVALSLNVAMAVFGGTAPMVAIYLVSREHLDSGPAFYMMGVAVISLVALLTWHPALGSRKPLPAAG